MTTQRTLLITAVVTLVAAGAAFFYIRNITQPRIVLGQARGSFLGSNTADVEVARRRRIGTEIEAIEVRMGLLLAPGATREKIERVLKEQKMIFHFDPLQQCYDVDVDPATKSKMRPVVSLAIYVDGSNRLTKLEGRVSPDP